MWIHCNDKTISAITKAAVADDSQVVVSVLSNTADGLRRIRISRDFGKQGWSVDVEKGQWFRMVDGQPEVRNTTPAELVDMELDRAESLEQAVGLCGGAFSMCWDNMYSGNANAGVFEDERARAIVDQLVGYVNANYLPRGEFTVELGGEVFTQAQWEAIQNYVAGTSARTDHTTSIQEQDTAPYGAKIVESEPYPSRSRG